MLGHRYDHTRENCSLVRSIVSFSPSVRAGTINGFYYRTITMETTRKNTVKIAFGLSAKAPKHLDVLRFAARKLAIPANSVHSIYKDENDHAYYIKFRDENEFNCFATGLDEQYEFEYEDGSKIFVRIEIACSLFRNVRIFNLPPKKRKVNRKRNKS